VPQGTPSELDGPTPELPRPWTPAQRHMAADLIAIGTEHGRLLADGRVAVPLPLAEVSARSGRGRNCGTVYAHARALRPAVSTAPGSSGLVLDLDALSWIAGAGSGPRTTRQTRAHFGQNPKVAHSTVEPARQALPSPAVPLSEVLGLMRDIVALVSALVSAPPAGPAAEVLSGLADDLDNLAGLADPPRGTSRTIRDFADRVADFSRDLGEKGGRVFNKDPGQNLPPSLADFRETPQRSRTTDLAELADRGGNGPGRSDEALGSLLRPLSELAERASLVGLTDREGLRQALVPYSDAQVRHAVRQTLALARAGTVKSPIGWLVTKARQADDAFFPPASSLHPAPPPPGPTVEEVVPDPEAEAAVAALEAAPVSHAGELGRIDALIQRATPKKIAQKMFADAAWLHSTRAQFWRSEHPAPPPPPKEGTT
jgi:hypothetical protein